MTVHQHPIQPDPQASRLIAGLPSCGAVLGIDVGYSETRPSNAVCCLEWTASNLTWAIERFRAVEPERADSIGRIACDRRIQAAALDGPMRNGFEVIGRYRTAERILTRRFHKFIGKPGQSSAPVGRRLNRAANECAAIVLERCCPVEAAHPCKIHPTAVVEAFPTSFLGMMIDQPVDLECRRGNRSDVYFRHLATSNVIGALIEHCLPGRAFALGLGAVTDHDERAALVCAITALSVAADDFVAVGDDDGWIVLPPRKFIQPWAWDLLRINAESEVGSPLYVARPSHH